MQGILNKIKETATEASSAASAGIASITRRSSSTNAVANTTSRGAGGTVEQTQEQQPIADAVTIAAVPAAETARGAESDQVAIVQGTIIDPSDELQCQGCGEKTYSVLVLTGAYVFYQCGVCAKKFCSKCREATQNAIPEVLRHPNAIESKNLSPEGVGSICKIGSCMRQCKEHWMIEFRSRKCKQLWQRLLSYLELAPCPPILFFEKPKVAEDDTVRKAHRIASIVEVVADVSGYSRIFKSLKLVYAGSNLVNALIQSDILNVLTPMMAALNHFGIKGPTGMLHVYYYSCKLELNRKLHPEIESEDFLEGQEGIYEPQCPHELLDVFGENCGIANWLYASALTAPHASNDWRSWYLSKVLYRDGWTVLDSMNDSVKLPDGTRCPAFALAVRLSPGGEKELVVSVRGSATPLDWCINFDEEYSPFEYQKGQEPGHVISGQVHLGMLRAARAILDDFGGRTAIHELSSKGYKIKIVGHSLGAGTSVLIAAELKNGFMNNVNLGILDKIPLIECIAYACPSCVSENLAIALREDKLVYVLVNRDDPIPRISRASVMRLADQVIEFSSTADKWMGQDKADFGMYAANYGRKGHMVEEETTVSGIVVTAVPVSDSASSLEMVNRGQSTISSSVSTSDSAGEVTVIATESSEQPSTDNASSLTSWKLPSINVSVSNVSYKSSGEQRAAGLVPSDYEARQKWVGTPLVIPGIIVCMYLDSVGQLRAALGDYRMAALQELSRIGEEPLLHHFLTSYLASLRGLRNINISGLRRASLVEINSKSSSNSLASSVTDGVVRCAVCELNPTWAYITHSDSTRAFVSHICSICRKICCSVCAPAGEQIPGDGVNQFETLQDFRIPIPSLGMLDPHRVCHPCYMSCYSL